MKTSKQREYQKRWYDKLSPERKEERKKKLREYTRKHYQNNKEMHYEWTRRYYKRNSKKINERQRQLRYINKNKPVPRKKYSFYRNVIQNKEIGNPFWKQLLSLALTPRQRKLAQLGARGVINQQVQADKLKVTQGSVAKMWGVIIKRWKNK